MIGSAVGAQGRKAAIAAGLVLTAVAALAVLATASPKATRQTPPATSLEHRPLGR